MHEFTHEEQDSDVRVTPIDSASRRTFFRIAVIALLLEPLVVFGVLIFVGVPWWMIGCIAVFGVGLLVGIFWLIALMLWKPWQRRYPAQPLATGAVSQSWQSFAFGSLGRLNNCLTIIADEKHLHLVPIKPLKWVGCDMISLPLDRITNVTSSLMPMQKTAELDGHAITGPDWAMQLAGSDAET